MNVFVWILRDLLIYWRTIVLILTPIVLLPLPILIEGTESKCAYVMIVTSTYWVAEVAPLAATAFLPIFLFPLLGVLGVKQTCMEYLKDTNWIFVAGLIMAAAFEESNLHKRIAYRVLLWMGDKPRWLVLGFMATTAFLSMWMSNTAAVAMMCPIAVVILSVLVQVSRDSPSVATKKVSQSKSPTAGSGRNEPVVGKNSKAKIQKTGRKSIRESSSIRESPNVDPESKSGQAKRSEDPKKEQDSPPSVIQYLTTTGKEPEPVAEPKSVEIRPKPVKKSMATEEKELISNFDLLPSHLQGFCKASLLGIAYGASLGGTATLTGTGPNLIFLDRLQDINRNQSDVSFGSWMISATPLMIINVVLGWAWLVLYFMGFRALFSDCCEKKKKGKSIIQETLRAHYEELGNISFAEGSVIFWLSILVLLWILREPVFISGWDQWISLKDGYTSDACAGMLIAFILFVFPSQKPDFIWWRKDKSEKPKLRPSLMTWPIMQQKFSWSVIMLLGGGFALAAGSKASGLSDFIRRNLSAHLRGMHHFGIVTIILILITFFTEISSNSATATIFLPIVLDVARFMCVNPLYFGIPATLGASFAFMLPVATPPNAIVYETKMLKLKDMVISGFVMNLLCIVVTLISIHSWTYALFGLGQFPSWANDWGNNTRC